LEKYSGFKVLGQIFRRRGKKTFPPKPGQVNSGDLGLEPFSSEFGYDRGGPIDRFYIEKFLAESSGDIKERVLEIGDNTYTRQFGAGKVQQSDVLHIDENDPNATITGDISNAPHIPSDSFDCIILTQTLHLIYDCRKAIETCYRILKPGGVLLLTVPGITPIAHDQWQDTWYWSFTPTAMSKMMNENFHSGHTEINHYGNVYVATAFLYGMGVEEVTVDQLTHKDPFYPVIVTVRSIKT
jgi:SAM-dependent methyltransferase